MTSAEILRILLAALLLGVLSAACGQDSARTGLACQRVAPAGAVVPEGDPRAPGEPLEGLDVTIMTPRDVGDAGAEAGLSVTWRYHYTIGGGENAGYSECWCEPPPDGEVLDVFYDAAGQLVVFVHSGRNVDSARPQPEFGWGCEQA